MQKFEIEALYIDMVEDCTTPYDSEYFTVKAENKEEALKKARILASQSKKSLLAESLSIELQF